MKNSADNQMSESIMIWLLLAWTGGAMDAHSYLFRGHVFSSAQTGNILLFGFNMAIRDYPEALSHLWPILAFMMGVFVADRIRYSWHISNLHWRQNSLFIEIFLIVIVSFTPNSLDSLANVLLALACSLQVESFRTVHHRRAASTMLVGNLRSFTSALEGFIRTRSAEHLEEIIIFSSLIFSFIIGAICESILNAFFGKFSILLCCILLFLVLIMLSIKPKKELL